MFTEKEYEFLLHFILESDAIERVYNRPETILRQLVRGHTKGHVGTILALRSAGIEKKLLTEEMITSAQSAIVSVWNRKGAHRLHEKDCGAWRDRAVWVGPRGNMRECPSHLDVPELMRRHVAKVAEWQKICHHLSSAGKVRAIAQFHLDFLVIHPFMDGNGRTSRAIAYYMYRFAELPPFIFTAHDRGYTYYPCFSDPLDSTKMEEYFLSRTVLPAS